MTNAWRRKKYHCTHLLYLDDGMKACGRNLCTEDDIFSCCATCTEYKGKDRGLGDTIKRVTDAVGIKTCGKCQKRREKLNQMTDKLFNKGEENDG